VKILKTEKDNILILPKWSTCLPRAFRPLNGPALRTDGGDESGSSIGVLPEHGSSIPAGVLALSEATSESVWVYIAGGGIASGGGLADDELAEGNAGELVDLED